MKQKTTQQQMDELLAELKEKGEVPTLLLHSCCAPCSSYVLEYLSEYFRIIDFYYNPNISPLSEYEERRDELKRLISMQPHRYPVEFVEGKYDPESFFALAKGLEDLPEGGERCRRCFELRLRESAKMAEEKGADFFTTSLTISPLKNAELINQVGKSISDKYLPSDFKKKNGYKRSTELSREYDLYRQNYCGCIFSKMASNKEESEK